MRHPWLYLLFALALLLGISTAPAANVYAGSNGQILGMNVSCSWGVTTIDVYGPNNNWKTGGVAHWHKTFLWPGAHTITTDNYWWVGDQKNGPVSVAYTLGNGQFRYMEFKVPLTYPKDIYVVNLTNC